MLLASLASTEATAVKLERTLAYFTPDASWQTRKKIQIFHAGSSNYLGSAPLCVVSHLLRSRPHPGKSYPFLCFPNCFYAQAVCFAVDDWAS